MIQPEQNLLFTDQEKNLTMSRFIKTLKYKKEDIEEIFGYEEKTYQHPLYFCISRCIRIHIKEILSFV